MYVIPLDLIEQLQIALTVHPCRFQVRQDVCDGHLPRAGLNDERSLDPRLRQDEMIALLPLDGEAIPLKDSHQLLIGNRCDSTRGHDPA